jgi:hypothetical protein
MQFIPPLATAAQIPNTPVSLWEMAAKAAKAAGAGAKEPPNIVHQNAIQGDWGGGSVARKRKR